MGNHRRLPLQKTDLFNNAKIDQSKKSESNIYMPNPINKDVLWEIVRNEIVKEYDQTEESLTIFKLLRSLNREFKEVFSINFLIYVCNKEEVLNKALRNKPVIVIFELLRFYHFHQILEIKNKEDKVFLICCYILYGNLTKLTKNQLEEIRLVFLSTENISSDYYNILVSFIKRKRSVVNLPANEINLHGRRIHYDGNLFKIDFPVYYLFLLLRSYKTTLQGSFKHCKITSYNEKSGKYNHVETSKNSILIGCHLKIGVTSISSLQGTLKGCHIELQKIQLKSPNSITEIPNVYFLNCNLFIEEPELVLPLNVWMLHNTYVKCAPKTFFSLLKGDVIYPKYPTSMATAGLTHLINDNTYVIDNPKLLDTKELLNLSLAIVGKSDSPPISFLYLMHRDIFDQLQAAAILKEIATSSKKTIWPLLKILDLQKTRTVIASNPTFLNGANRPSNMNSLNMQILQSQLKIILLFTFQILKVVHQAKLSEEDKADLLTKIAGLSCFDFSSDDFIKSLRHPSSLIFKAHVMSLKELLMRHANLLYSTEKEDCIEISAP